MMTKNQKTKRERLFLIDGYSLAYRAYFAFMRNPLRTSKGKNTSAIFGFVNALLRILLNEKPEHIAVVFDSKEKTFRHDLYPEYKAQREAMPEDLSYQLGLLKDAVEAFNIPLIEKPGYEADDIIGTLAVKAKEEGVEAYLVTADKDFMQLVNDFVKIYKPGAKGDEPEILDREKVIEKFGVPPESVIDLLALIGDQSDNVPGVKGIGEKTATPLIQKYKTLENLLTYLDEIKQEGVRKKLAEQKENALLSRKLVTIDTNTPIDTSFHELNAKEWDKIKLKKLFNELEFKSIIKQLELDDSEEGPLELFSREEMESGNMNVQTSNADYRPVKSKNELNKMVTELTNAAEFVFDTETTSKSPLDTEVVGISFSAKPQKAWFIDLRGIEFDKKTLVKTLRMLLEDPKIIRGGQNVKFDILTLRSLEIQVTPPLFDTMIAAYILRPDGQHNLDSLAKQYLNYDMVSYSDLVGGGKLQRDIRTVDRMELLRYSCEDADITLQLWQVLKKELKEVNAEKLCTEIEFPLIDVLATMEINGVTIDKSYLAKLSKDLAGELSVLQDKIYNEAGTKFNINSTQQLSFVLFEQMGLQPVRKTKTGFSTDTSVLEQLHRTYQAPIIAYLLEYRQLMKLKSTYIDALPKLINPKTNKVHTSFNQTIAATGRLSSSNPNLQNIPIRTELGKKIRKSFIPSSKEYKIMSADYSQIELRIMAHITRDPGLLEAFENKEDIHATTAAKIFNISLNEVDADMRRKAKEVNFGIMYGMSNFGLASRLEIGKTEAKDIMDRYFLRFPKVREYIETTVNDAKKDGYVSTLLGRRRYLPEINSENNTIKQNAARQAINMPIQGTAADMIKLAMVRIHQKMKEKKLKSKMIIQVHDELVFDVHTPEINTLQKLVEKEMSSALDLKVPIEVDIGVGDNWLEAH